jgi:hypothetical protein
VTKSKAIAPEKKIVKSQLNEATEKLKLEAQRRLLRSKRFGVKLDEKEMKEIRAARFGIAPTTAAAADGKTKKAENNKENGKTSSKPSTQDILKKRAERFGLPVVEEKKQVVVDEKKTKSKKGNKKTVEPEAKTKKKIPIASNNNAKGKAGKITKKIMNAATPSINSKKKTTTSQTTTRADLLKQKTMKKMLEKADIVKDKKTIIHQRKANTINKNNSSVSAKQGDRVVTFETNSAPVTANKKRTAETNNNNNKNPKTPPKIVIQHLPTGKVVFVDGVPVKMKDKNNNNSATRKRERGFEKVRQQPQLAVSTNSSETILLITDLLVNRKLILTREDADKI